MGRRVPIPVRALPFAQNKPEQPNSAKVRICYCVNAVNRDCLLTEKATEMSKISSRYAPSIVRSVEILELAYSPAHASLSDKAMILFHDTQKRARADFEAMRDRGHGLMTRKEFFDGVLDCCVAQHAERKRLAKDRAQRHERALAQKEEALYA